MTAMVRSRAVAWCGVATLVGFATLGVMASPASAAIALVQQKTNNSSSASSLTVTFTTNVTTTAGNVLILVGGSSTGALTGVSGAGVGTWTKATSSLTNTKVEIWYGAVDVATNTSTTPVTATASATGAIYVSVTEWNGLSLAIDQTAAQGGTTSPASAPSITTTNASDLVVFGVADSSGNTYGTPTGGTWTALSPQITTPVAESVWYQIAAATGAFNPTVTETAHSWDAVITALKGCPATVSDPTTVTANAQSTSARVYWSTPNQVLILRNSSSTSTFTAPTTGTSYAVGAGGQLLGSATIVYNGAAGSFTQTTADAVNPVTANTTYYYKVHTNCDLTYSAGVVVNVKPGSTLAQMLWSYATTATTLAAPGIDDNDVVVWGGNDGKIHGADSGVGTPAITPFTAGGAIQSRPVIVPAAYSATGVNVAYVTSQDGFVYAINTTTGAQIWKSTVPGSGLLQGGAAVWLKAFDTQPICGAVTDVVFVGTRDTVNHATNSVYALNGSSGNVTTTGGGNCTSTSVAMGGILWQFTGSSTGSPNPKMDYISSTPYIDYNANALWVTSRAQAGTSQPSLWKFNLTNGTLANTTCGSGTPPSVWCLGDIDTPTAQSADGNWMYVTTAMSTPTLQAVPIGGGTVQTYTPAGSGAMSAPVPLGSGSIGAPTTIAYVNSAKNTATATTSCTVTLPSVTAGNAIIVASAVSAAVGTITGIADTGLTGSSFYTLRSTVSPTNARVEIWSAFAGGSGTATITLTYSTSLSAVCIAAQYSGVGTIGEYLTSSGTSKIGTIAVTTNESNNYVVAGYSYANSTAATASVGTLRQSAALATPIGGALSDTFAPSAASWSNTVNVSSTNVAWGVAAVELRSVTTDPVVFTRTGSTRLVQFSGAGASPFYSPANFFCGCGGMNGGTPVYDGVGRLYVGTSNGVVYRFDAAYFSNSSKFLTLVSAVTVVGDPSYDGVLNRVYVGSADGHVYGLTTAGW